MPITVNLDGDPSAALMLPLWQIQRPYQLSWLEVTIESETPESWTATGFHQDLVVQLWKRRRESDPFEAVAEAIVPEGTRRVIEPQLAVGYGFEIPVNLPAGCQVAVVHNGGLDSWYDWEQKPSITVTPHGTWA